MGVRCRHPIPPWVEHDHTLVTDTELPTTAEGATVGAHDPREWGYKATCQHATTIPGYWPDEDRQHGLLLIHHRVNNHMKQYDEERHRYVPKAYREPWQRKYGLGRRYSKNAPKVTVPLQDKVSEFQMPDMRYNKKKPLIGYAWKNNKDQGPGFN